MLSDAILQKPLRQQCCRTQSCKNCSVSNAVGRNPAKTVPSAMLTDAILQKLLRQHCDRLGSGRRKSDFDRRNHLNCTRTPGVQSEWSHPQSKELNMNNPKEAMTKTPCQPLITNH
jgi:hypothetical protein